MKTTEEAISKGLGFGLTSAVITTLGTLIGLDAVSSSKTVIIGGISAIAIADAASDALGIHISEESQKRANHKYIWIATVSTFFSKFIFAATFILPLVVFGIKTAIIISIVWGFFLISTFSFFTALKRNENPFIAVAEHCFVAAVVLVVIHFTGKFINSII